MSQPTEQTRIENADYEAEFEPLRGFENDYEIQTTFPYNIKNRKTGRIVAEGEYRQNVYQCLKKKTYYKHILVAKQFIDYPDNLPQVDHKNRIKTDYHIDNLRFVSNSDNGKNKQYLTVNTSIHYEYVDEISNDAIVADEYGNQTFENYYFHDDIFYFFIGVQYRKLYINEKKNDSLFVNMITEEGKKIHVYYNKFKRLHDLI